MQNAKFVFIVSCGLAVVACSTTSSTTAGNNGDASAGAGDDGSNGTPPPGDDSGGGPGNPFGGRDASITCKGMADCGGAGHACCFSTMTFATMCVTGTCGSDYTQCMSQSDCPAGTQCVPSPLGAGVQYCGRGDGGAGDAAATPDAVADGGGASASDGSADGSAE
jgi:hypothetical protein